VEWIAIMDQIALALEGTIDVVAEVASDRRLSFGTGRGSARPRGLAFSAGRVSAQDAGQDSRFSDIGHDRLESGQLSLDG
jgi:hypothetical protein